jgi:hypothetical protein
VGEYSSAEFGRMMKSFDISEIECEDIYSQSYGAAQTSIILRSEPILGAMTCGEGIVLS